MRLLYSRHLEHFLAIYDARSLRQAAQRCGVTQPALTKSLHLLERAMSVTLFERQANGIRPTEAAEVFRRHATQIVNSARYLQMEIEHLRGGHGGTLRIGAGMAWSVTRMPAVLAELHRQYPRMEISLQTGVADQLMPRLLNGELDVVIAAAPDNPLPVGFQTVALQRTAMMVFARAQHPLARRRTVTLKDLAGCEFAGFMDDADAQQRMDALFKSAGFPPCHVVLRSASLATLLATAAVSESLAILSDLLAAQAEAYGLRRIRLIAGLWDLSMGITFRTQAAEMAPMQTLRELCCKTTVHRPTPPASDTASRLKSRSHRHGAPSTGAAS